MTRGRRPSESPAPALTDERSPAWMADIADALRGWYLVRKRRLPWRDEPTPYRVWVSEIMLQQTQVATVLPYFERFIGAFPTLADLAAASEEAVFAQWAGLGYYRRARHLHAAARRVLEAHDGTFPSDVETLLTLPGVGRYTAGAIASIAFGVRAPLLDGNVARVLSRLIALPDAVNATAGERRLWALADALVPAADPSSHNQALMELGALVCTPRTPECQACPLADRCRARLDGRPEAYPVKVAKAPPKPVSAVAALLHDQTRADHVLVARRPPDGLLGGLWELPGVDLETARAARKRSLSEALFERTGLAAKVHDLIATVEHQFTHRSLTLEVFRASSSSTQAEPRAFYDAVRWLPLARVEDEVPVSTLTRKVLAAVRSGAPADARSPALPGLDASGEVGPLFEADARGDLGGSR